MTYCPKEVLSEQVLEEHGVVINGEQFNDPIEEDDHTNNVVEDDGTNTLINDSFNVRMDDDDDDDHENIYDFDMMFMIYLFLRRHMDPFMKDPTQILSLLYC